MGVPPSEYREKAVSYTDFWEAYVDILPTSSHLTVVNGMGKTNPIERFNNKLRQRISRLVMKSLSFSKKPENHVGAIWYFFIIIMPPTQLI